MTEQHQIGETIQSRYRITSILGQGGIGITYAAEDQQTGDCVALKTLSFRRVNEWKILELFEREAKVLAQLDHPAIARYLDYFQIDRDHDRDFYLVQELVDGRSLAQAIVEGWHGTEEDIKSIAEQVLEVLIYLHELKPPIIHRDIKPQNILLKPNGKIAIVDFGSVQDTYRNTQVSGSTIVGTYGYMPPEQFRGKAIPATDLYALGATILFLLTGRSPADLPEVKFKIDFRSSVNISAHFADWIDHMIEPAIEDRFSNARQALNALRKEAISSLDRRIREIEVKLSLAGNPTPVKRRYEKPLGSRIDLKKNDHSLEINIPPSYWRGDGIGILLFAIFWNGFLLMWTSLASRVGVFSLFSIPFWLVGVGCAYVGLSSVFGKVHLMIGDRHFSIVWDVLGIKRQVNGKTLDLRPVELRSFYEVNNQPVMQVCLNQGVYSHKFGSGLSRVEKEWLQQEINEFLDEWRTKN
ncbi:serine/threonine protein kinase [Pseudanabaena sp. FACHB-1998]|uniref:protein kinase domain-containing protein n=1 Tax=Pseudanabaena sp. FACHB-1998 TaxID=2692858 RepID=UPI00168075E7|nr:serine/threonine protein kinase [Pseudanabaena sp. FACHB-1998]